MAFLSSRRGRARLAPELDDAGLGRLLKSLQAATGAGTIATTDLYMAQVSRLLDQGGADWDRRTHRLSVLAHCLSASHGPRAWATREPRNASALVLSAWAQLERGRSLGRPQDAVGIIGSCLRAAELAPKDPTPWVVLLGLSRLERRSQPEVFSLWHEVLTRDRWNRAAYLSMLRFLGPQEMGSRVQVLDFVDAVRAGAPADAPCAATELTAEVLHYQSVLARGGVEALMARTHWTHFSTAQALGRAVCTWGRPGAVRHAAAVADLNLLAYALMAAERRVEARPVFEVINGTVAAWPWSAGGDPVSEFERARIRSGAGV
ncbi:hypothetical protein OHB33_00875 [Streptomyces sp. NBC_01558]|uniref:hypothetical protein n=1 Tax=Streptomyces sp. NBC_01558 TaxID=2975878 RepID=UPI002DD9092C|nr:hypothetical protein [Streptomyces sp. NBC_01558]WSD74980.1 hypothetical protein OHB33_00875 [Streptomyces sp. NBC_01558]